MKDETVIIRKLSDSIKEYANMDEKELQECINEIDKELDKEEKKKQFVVDVYNEKDCSELVNVSDDGRTITLFEDPSFEIQDESLKEKILSQLYFQERNVSKTAFQDNSKKICDNIQQDNVINFSEKQKTQLDRKKIFAALKVSSRESGYKILNSLGECESGESIELKAIEIEKGKKISFQDLKSAYENFTIDYRDDSWTDLYVKDRKTGEEITDPELAKIAKFASVWVGAVGTKWMADEELRGITYAFNEPSERLYTQLGTLVEKCMKGNGMIDTKAIYEELAKDPYKHSEEAIRNLLSNQGSMKILYDFYKMQINDAKMETRLADTSNKFLFGFTPDHLVESEVEDTLNGIEQFNREISIDDYISKVQGLVPDAKGGNKQCFFVDGYALLKTNSINEKELASVMPIEKELKEMGVKISTTLDYRVNSEDEGKEFKSGYILQERAQGHVLHKTETYHKMSKEELEKSNQEYIGTLRSLQGEKQELFDKFVSDWIEITKRGLMIDPSKTSNFYYDQGNSINFIDLNVDKRNNGGNLDMNKICGEMAVILGNGTKYHSYLKDPQDRAKANEALSPILKKLTTSLVKQGMNKDEVIAILNGRYPEVDLTEKGTIGQGLQQEMGGKPKKQKEYSQEAKPAIHGEAAKSFGRNTQPATSEVNKTTSVMAERTNMKALKMERSKLMISCKNNPENLSPENQKRLNEIAHQIALYNAQMANQQSDRNNRQKKNNGMSMGR